MVGKSRLLSGWACAVFALTMLSDAAWAAPVRRCPGAIVEKVPALSFRATAIRSVAADTAGRSWLSCPNARRVVRRFLRRRMADDEGCAIPAANDGSCSVTVPGLGRWSCDLSYSQQLRGVCEAVHGWTVYWHQVDRQTAGRSWSSTQ